MAFGTLVAKLALDSSSFDAGMNRAKRSSLDFGNNLERTVGNKLKAAFGAGAIISAVTSAISSITSHVKSLKEEADAAGVSIEKLQEMSGRGFGKMSNETAFAVTEATRGFGRITEIAKNLAATVGMTHPLGILANLASAAVDPKGFLERRNAMVPGAPGPLTDFPGRAGEMTGPANPFTTPMNAFEISRRSSMPNVNALQAAGAATRLQGETTELKTAVQVLRNIDFTLKKIDTKSSGENLVLAP